MSEVLLLVGGFAAGWLIGRSAGRAVHARTRRRLEGENDYLIRELYTFLREQEKGR